LTRHPLFVLAPNVSREPLADFFLSQAVKFFSPNVLHVFCHLLESRLPLRLARQFWQF
jgi:hypothetical protein